MKWELKAKITVDIAMTLTLLVQMGYMILGDLAHEIVGTVTIALWIAHNLLHRKWYASLFKSNYGVIRTVNTVINALLLVSVIGIIWSSLVLSSYVFSFLGLETGTGTARIVHMVSVYWCFILSSLHLGLHWSRMMKIIQKNGKAKNGKLRQSKRRTFILHTVAVSVSLYGLYAFAKQQLASYMFARVLFVFFDFEQSPVLFFAEYVSMLVLFASITYYATALIYKSKIRGRVNGRNECAVE